MASEFNIFSDNFGWLEGGTLALVNQIKLQALSEGKQVLDLSMINPDLSPPRFLQDKLLESAVKPNSHRYAVSRGIRRLREAFACKYARRFGIKLDPENEICVCMGSKDGLQRLLQCFGAEQSAVLVGRPCYPAYLSALHLAQRRYDFFDIEESAELTLRNIKAKLATGLFGLVLLNFPNNPTSFTVDRDFYRSLKVEVEKVGCWVINDFVYGEMLYNGEPAQSLLAEPDMRKQAVEIYSLSKAYSVPGWRVAAIVGNSDLVRCLSRLKTHVDYGIFLPIQEASAAGLAAESGVVEPITATYARRAIALAGGLRRLGWRVPAVQAGACVWAEVPPALRGQGSLEVTRRFLQEFGVMPLPGVAFGKEYDDYLRFALVLSESAVQEVLERMRRLSLKLAGNTPADSNFQEAKVF